MLSTVQYSSNNEVKVEVESLFLFFLRAMPVIERGTGLDRSYYKLPVLLVDDFAMITPAMIRQVTYFSTVHYTTLHYIILHYTALHYTALHYTALHCTTPHYTTLYYTTVKCRESPSTVKTHAAEL